MKFEKLYILYLVFVLAVLCIIGALIAGASRPLTEEEQAQADNVYAATDFGLAPVSSDHGADAVISWEDPGMEAHIRFLLNRPEGDIRHSDVWDIQVLSIQTTFQVKFDIALDALPESAECFTRANTLNNSNYYRSLGNRQFPEIRSLRDLRHFDSLQVLSVNQKPEQQITIDLTGIEDCRYLHMLQICNMEIVSLEPLSDLEPLEMLFLQDCGKVNLQPLERRESLAVLSVSGCQVPTLQPLEQLPKLRFLNLLDTIAADGSTAPKTDTLEILLS